MEPGYRARTILYVLIGAVMVVGGMYVALRYSKSMPGVWVLSYVKALAGLAVFLAGALVIALALKRPDE